MNLFQKPPAHAGGFQKSAGIPPPEQNRSPEARSPEKEKPRSVGRAGKAPGAIFRRFDLCRAGIPARSLFIFLPAGAFFLLLSPGNRLPDNIRSIRHSRPAVCANGTPERPPP